MTYIYPEAVSVEVILTGTSAYYDLTGDVVSTIHGEYGFRDTKYTDRTAPPGNLVFTLKNIDHQYLFGVGTTLAGWQKGVRIQCSVTSGGQKKSVFSGFLRECTPSEPIYGVPTVKVTVTDWMQKASSFQLEKMQVLTDRRIGDGVQAILDRMPIPPEETDIGQGVDTLPTIFDATQRNSVAITEFQRLALSEFGYIYLRMPKGGGEKLVVEGRGVRSGGLEYASVADEPTFLLSDPNGYIILQENGIPILLDNREEITELAYMRVNVENGDNVLNKVSAKVYPRRVDTSIQTLFTLRYPIQLLSGETKTNIRGQYVDPNGGGTKVNADPSTMVALVKNTDYKMFLNSDGTGTDLTDALEINYSFGSEGITFDSIRNTGTVNGWVTTLNARGYGIYFYDPIEYINTNTGSVQNIDVFALQLDQKYQAEVDTGIGIVDTLIDREGTERPRIRKMFFNANTDTTHMSAFLDLDIGDLVPLNAEAPSISGDYLINRKEFDIYLGGVINYAFEYAEFLPLVSQYWQLETVGYSELGLTTYVGL